MYAQTPKPTTDHYVSCPPIISFRVSKGFFFGMLFIIGFVTPTCFLFKIFLTCFKGFLFYLNRFYHRELWLIYPCKRPTPYP